MALYALLMQMDFPLGGFKVREAWSNLYFRESHSGVDEIGKYWSQQRQGDHLGGFVVEGDLKGQTKDKEKRMDKRYKRQN